MAIQRAKVSRLYKDLDFNFNVNPATGDVAKVTDVNAVKQSIKSLILTNYHERPFNPRLGTGIRAILFENLTPQAAITLEKLVYQVIENYEKRAVLKQVRAKPNYDSNSYAITIEYSIRGIDQPQIIKAELRRLR